MFYLNRLMIILFALNIGGCLSPLALDYTVMSYDQTALDIQSKQILLNIARSYKHHPMHFTGVSNIAATFNFQFNAGATPAFTGESGSLLTPIFGGTVSENPTISIQPIEGEEFTRRLLTPIQENKLTLLLRQGADIDLMLRLLAKELRITEDGHAQVFPNRPAFVDGYRSFRQAVLHLSAIQDRHSLFIEPLLFDKTLQLDSQNMDASQLSELEEKYEVKFKPHSSKISFVKRVTGHIVLTNYDPQLLTNDERIKLSEEADDYAADELMVDIRPGYPGGELPIHGVFRLRSFHNILNFIGRGIQDEPEIRIDKSPKTPNVRENPNETIKINVEKENSRDDEIAIEYEGDYYSIDRKVGSRWNNEGFRLLYLIYQMTVSELSQQAAPSITISK